MTYWVFCDIDGTLREAPDVALPRPRPGCQEFFTELRALDVKIVLWSAGGVAWAHDAAKTLGITQYCAAIHGKDTDYRQYIGPKYFIDDWPEVLHRLIEPQERRFIVPSYYYNPNTYVADCALAHAARAVAVWRAGQEAA